MQKTVSLVLISILIGAVAFSNDDGGEIQDQGAGDAQPVVIEVDCNAGDSIGRALDTPAAELIVEISASTAVTRSWRTLPSASVAVWTTTPTWKCGARTSSSTGRSPSKGSRT